ncbi:hypothetical protein [Terrimonas alba]|uniref:hypothetical protein n=1 Tax=Terrimonas alba TaxID=3349636 RepID=UPI0035F47963
MINSIFIKRFLQRKIKKSFHGKVGLYGIMFRAGWVYRSHSVVGTCGYQEFHGRTGPKTDIWLVKTVAALLVPIGTGILPGPLLKRDFWVVLLLGTLTPAGLAIIDFITRPGEPLDGSINWMAL